MSTVGDMEFRFAAEIRVAARLDRASGGATGPGRLCGVAAPFNTSAEIGGFREVIRPGAFAASLAGNADVRCLIDHDDSKLLGRTRSGTLRLFESRDKGLCYEVDLPDTTLGRDLYALAERGDLSGVSFGFTVAQPDGEAWPTPTTRELRDVNLAEISILHRLPAYDQTTISARAKQLGRHQAAARLRVMALAL